MEGIWDTRSRLLPFLCSASGSVNRRRRKEKDGAVGREGRSFTLYTNVVVVHTRGGSANMSSWVRRCTWKTGEVEREGSKGRYRFAGRDLRSRFLGNGSALRGGGGKGGKEGAVLSGSK